MCGEFADGSEPEGSAEAEEWNESGSSTETETHGTELFWLDYQADSGSITSVLVHKVNAPSFKQCFGLFSFLLDLISLCSLCFCREITLIRWWNVWQRVTSWIQP